jgi:hypothetical protein
MNEKYEKIVKQPTELTLCVLDVVVMPNGEVIHQGNTVGWFKDMKEFLQVKKYVDQSK